MSQFLAVAIRPTAFLASVLFLELGSGLAHAAPIGFKACQPEDVERM